MNEKHAYLIMAHNQFAILEKLLLLLDDTRNDFYIHIDKKVKEFPFDQYEQLVAKSSIYFVERTDVRWGGYSQIACELTMLREATKRKYQYYHLLSGVDLPLKTNDEIHGFFQKHCGKEFVHFCEESSVEQVRYRVSKYHFMERPVIDAPFVYKTKQLASACLRRVQGLIGINRKWDPNRPLQYGANWFSITDGLARYVLAQSGWIEKHFKMSYCADELFLQTIVDSSPYKDNLFVKEKNGEYVGCMRYIDWKRGRPYVFRKEDF